MLNHISSTPTRNSPWLPHCGNDANLLLSIVIASFLGFPNIMCFKTSHLSLSHYYVFLNDPITSLQWHIWAIHLLSSYWFPLLPGPFYHVLEALSALQECAPSPPVCLTHCSLNFSSNSVHVGLVTLRILLPGGREVVQWEGDFHIGSCNTRWNIPEILISFRDKEDLLSWDVSWSLIFPKQTLIGTRKSKA